MEMVVGHDEVQFWVPIIVSMRDLSHHSHCIFGPVISNYYLFPCAGEMSLSIYSVHAIVEFVGSFFSLLGRKAIHGIHTYMKYMTNWKWINRESIGSLKSCYYRRLNKAIVYCHWRTNRHITWIYSIAYHQAFAQKLTRKKNQQKSLNRIDFIRIVKLIIRNKYKMVWLALRIEYFVEMGSIGQSIEQ